MAMITSSSSKYNARAVALGYVVLQVDWLAGLLTNWLIDGLYEWQLTELCIDGRTSTTDIMCTSGHTYIYFFKFYIDLDSAGQSCTWRFFFSVFDSRETG